MIKSSEHRPEIDDLLKQHGLAPEQFEVVPNVQKWCHQNGVHEDNPNRIAKCLCRREDRACHIVMSAEITNEMISSAKSAMEFRGFDHVWQTLDTDEKFLRHTVLHEIACHVLSVTEQEPRDEWAFSEMRGDAK